MHGSIFLELRKYVDAKLGGDAWGALLSQAGMPGREFTLLAEYPDQDVVTLVAAASSITGTPAPALLEDFGAFIAPDLLEMFWGSIDPSWKTLDVIEHTEETIHKVVRLKNPGAHPPELRVARSGPDQVVIDYRSSRRLCQVAKGIARGLATHFGETVVVSESECMHQGSERCMIAVTRKH
jgi:hypothetical protein